MTKATLRSTVHTYIDEADTQVLEVIYQLLEVYRQRPASQLTDHQQQEVRERSVLYKAGKIKGLSIDEARKRLK